MRADGLDAEKKGTHDEYDCDRITDFVARWCAAWPHSAEWGYYPSGGLGVILLVLVILALTGRRGRAAH